MTEYSGQARRKLVRLIVWWVVVIVAGGLFFGWVNAHPIVTLAWGFALGALAYPQITARVLVLRFASSIDQALKVGNDARRP